MPPPRPPRSRSAGASPRASTPRSRPPRAPACPAAATRTTRSSSNAPRRARRTCSSPRTARCCGCAACRSASLPLTLSGSWFRRSGLELGELLRIDVIGVLVGGESAGHHLVAVGLEGLEDLRPEVQVALGELRLEALEQAEHVGRHHALAVAVHPGAVADRRHA